MQEWKSYVLNINMEPSLQIFLEIMYSHPHNSHQELSSAMMRLRYWLKWKTYMCSQHFLLEPKPSVGVSEHLCRCATTRAGSIVVGQASFSVCNCLWKSKTKTIQKLSPHIEVVVLSVCLGSNQFLLFSSIKSFCVISFQNPYFWFTHPVCYSGKLNRVENGWMFSLSFYSHSSTEKKTFKAVKKKTTLFDVM